MRFSKLIKNQIHSVELFKLAKNQIYVFGAFLSLQKKKNPCFLSFLTPGRRSLSLHAEKVSYMYQSENKHEINENHLIHGFANLSIGKQNMKNFEEYHFFNTKS